MLLIGHQFGLGRVDTRNRSPNRLCTLNFN